MADQSSHRSTKIQNHWLQESQADQLLRHCANFELDDIGNKDFKKAEKQNSKHKELLSSVRWTAMLKMQR